MCAIIQVPYRLKILIKDKLSELETLFVKLQLPESRIEDYKVAVEKIHDMIRNLEFDKEK